MGAFLHSLVLEAWDLMRARPEGPDGCAAEVFNERLTAYSRRFWCLS